VVKAKEEEDNEEGMTPMEEAVLHRPVEGKASAAATDPGPVDDDAEPVVESVVVLQGI
jgi:hypothetical protein